MRTVFRDHLAALCVSDSVFRRCFEISYVHSLPCGHALCAECLYDYAYLHLKAGHQLHSTTCAYCRAPISRPPVLSLDWQDRVDDMAFAKGIPIPKRIDFKWPPPPDAPTRLRSDRI